MKKLVAGLLMLLAAASCPALTYHDLPNDCMITALEAHKRLEGIVAWENVICYEAYGSSNKHYGHCVLAYQVTCGGSVFLYDGSGSHYYKKSKDNSIQSVVAQIEEITQDCIVMATYIFTQ